MTAGTSERWTEIKALAASGDAAAAFSALRAMARPDDDFPTQRRYARLLAQLPKAALGLRPIRIALLASSTTDQLAEMVRLWLGLEGFDAQILEPPFGQIAQSVLDPASALHGFEPDVVWFFTTHRDVHLRVPPGAAEADVASAIDAAVEQTKGLWRALSARLPALIVQNNVDIPAVDTFGHFEAGIPWSGRSLQRGYNLALGRAPEPGTAIFDLDHVAGAFGKQRWFDTRYWYHSKHAFSFDALGIVAFQFARLVGAAKGGAKKCLVLDLDNTLWGGVIGDDGLERIELGAGPAGEAFADFQAYVGALKERGVILAVCSKNAEENAREPFLKHPGMRLTLDDIAVFRANWDNKADNIRLIARSLDIGLDSLVFVDDNPAERALVRRELPMVSVPELPADPSDYVAALHGERLFETISFSSEDAARNGYYKANASRQELRELSTDLGAYQRSLLMIAETGAVEGFHVPRAAQLINKSNQFHLTGTRYSEARLVALLAQPQWFGRQFALRDRFGDNGLISVVLLRREGDSLDIDTWVMSCRVLGRGMEEFIVNELAALARGVGCRRLVGRYVPSRKNGLVADLYRRLGFAVSADGAEWSRDADAGVLDCHIAAAGDSVVASNTEM
jgi:FkbH-like protein